DETLEITDDDSRSLSSTVAVTLDTSEDVVAVSGARRRLPGARSCAPHAACTLLLVTRTVLSPTQPDPSNESRTTRQVQASRSLLGRPGRPVLTFQRRHLVGQQTT